MEILRQIGIIFAVCLGGALISSLLPISVPANVIGLILLFILLCLHVIKPRHIEKSGNFLLQNMAFFFVPAGVGIMDNYSYVSGSVLPLLLISLITMILTFAVTAYTVMAMIRLQERGKKRDE